MLHATRSRRTCTQALFPADSRASTGYQSQYQSNGRNTYNSYNGIVKLDHHFSDREQISIHYLGTTGTQSADVGSHFADYFQTAPMHIHNASIILDSTLSSRFLNQLTFAASSFLQTFNDRNQNVQHAGNWPEPWTFRHSCFRRNAVEGRVRSTTPVRPLRWVGRM